MCTYNGARYLPEQLASMAAQTRPPDELVVCDDLSTDDTRRIIEVFAKQSDFSVRLYVNEKNLGPIQNFAKAIGLCEGEIIALSDQDDVWCPSKLERMTKEFARALDVGMVFTNAGIVDEDLRPRGYTAWQCYGVEFEDDEQRLFDQGKALDVLLTRNVVTGATMAFRARYKDLILPIPHLDKGALHDYWIALLIAAVANVAFIAEPLIEYRAHEGQHTGLPPPQRESGTNAKHRREAKAARYPVKNHLLEPVCDRLREHKFAEDEYRTHSLEKLKHLRTRAAIRHSNFVVRVRRAMSELLTLRYHRYSDGWHSYVKDVSLPHKLLRLNHLVTRRIADGDDGK